MLFIGVDSENCLAINEVFQEFCSRFGQKVSEAKSRVFFSPNVEPDQRDHLSNILGFSSTSNLGRYLCFPLKHTGVRKHNFDFVLDRVKKKPAGWKVIYYPWLADWFSFILLPPPFRTMSCSMFRFRIKSSRVLIGSIGTFRGDLLTMLGKCIGSSGML